MKDTKANEHLKETLERIAKTLQVYAQGCGTPSEYRKGWNDGLHKALETVLFSLPLGDFDPAMLKTSNHANEKAVELHMLNVPITYGPMSHIEMEMQIHLANHVLHNVVCAFEQLHARVDAIDGKGVPGNNSVNECPVAHGQKDETTLAQVGAWSSVHALCYQLGMKPKENANEEQLVCDFILELSKIRMEPDPRLTLANARIEALCAALDWYARNSDKPFIAKDALLAVGRKPVEPPDDPASF